MKDVSSFAFNSSRPWVRALFGSFLLVASFGCTPDETPPQQDTGDGDGDPTTGDGDGDPTTSGDGDGDPPTGDGDGDPTTGDGDGDGDGDGACPACEPVGDYPDCVPYGDAKADSIYEGSVDGPDNLCTVTAVDAGAPVVMSFDCQGETATITLDVSPPWIPPFAVDDEVLLSHEFHIGEAEGNGHTYTIWQLEDPDTQALIASHGDGFYPTLTDDLLSPTPVTDVCAPECIEGAEGGSEAASLLFDDGQDELTLFGGHTGTLGAYTIWTGTVRRSLYCSEIDAIDGAYGNFEIFVAPTP